MYGAKGKTTTVMANKNQPQAKKGQEVKAPVKKEWDAKDYVSATVSV